MYLPVCVECYQQQRPQIRPPKGPVKLPDGHKDKTDTRMLGEIIQFGEWVRLTQTHHIDRQ
jgi:hypothetical protein